MNLGVQRRNIYLAPATGLDRHWCARLFNVPDIYGMFGFDGPVAAPMGQRIQKREVILGILRLVENRIRIGFVMMFPPTSVVPFWEIGYAITEPRCRDAFTAINALDAMGYYMWEDQHVSMLCGRTRKDNRAAEAVVRRMGFVPLAQVEHLGHAYSLYAQNPPAWALRKARLVEGEKTSPSPAGQAFALLRGTPCVPVVAQRAAPCAG